MATRLKRRSAALCQVAVRTNVEAEEAVSEVLQQLFAASVSSFQEPESGQVELSLFLPWEQRPQPARQRQLRERLAWLAECGLQIAPAQVRFQRLANRDWKESWKRHFKPRLIGRRLLLKPSWSLRKPDPGQVLVVLDPGLSFGTGQHPTTFFCLQELVRARQAGQGQSFLDIGTGSGILGIAAAKLGYGDIQAFDNDPDAVRVAIRNARRNRVLHRITIRCADLGTLQDRARHPYDLVCANLIAPLLVEQRIRLCRLVKPGGVLVLAGILAREFASLDAAFHPLVSSRLRQKIQGEWQSAAYQIMR